ncbi:MAG: hypothetical protein ACYCXN_07110, partial [Acidimicrobiales bacterium]
PWRGAHHDGTRRGCYDRSEHVEPAWYLDFDDQRPDQRHWHFDPSGYLCPRRGAHHDGARRGCYDRSEHVEPAWYLDFDDHRPDQRHWLFGKLAGLYRPAGGDPGVDGYRRAGRHHSGRAWWGGRSHGTGNDPAPPRWGNNHDHSGITASGGAGEAVPAGPQRPGGSGQLYDDEPSRHAFARRRQLVHQLRKTQPLRC